MARPMAAPLLGGNVTSDTRTEPGGVSRRNQILLLLALVVVIDVAALFIAPPFDPKNEACSFPVCFINGNLELPVPHVVWSASGTPSTSMITFDVSITSTI